MSSSEGNSSRLDSTSGHTQPHGSAQSAEDISSTVQPDETSSIPATADPAPSQDSPESPTSASEPTHDGSGPLPGGTDPEPCMGRVEPLASLYGRTESTRIPALSSGTHPLRKSLVEYLGRGSVDIPARNLSGEHIGRSLFSMFSANGRIVSIRHSSRSDLVEIVVDTGNRLLTLHWVGDERVVIGGESGS